MLVGKLVSAVDFDLLNGATAAPEDDAHGVGSAVERGFDEGGILAQCGLKVFQHARVPRWLDHIS